MKDKMNYEPDELKEIRIENREQFQRYIKVLFQKTDYINYIILNGDPYDNSLFLDYFEKNNILPKDVRKWPGTVSSGNNKLYKAKLTKDLRTILLSFDNFFIPNYDKYGQESPIKTSWGISDICFYDSNNKLLSYTTTHEGWVFADTNGIKELKDLEI